MNEDRCEQAIDLVRALWIEEVYHATNVLHAIDLGAQVGVVMKISTHETAVLFGGD